MEKLFIFLGKGGVGKTTSSASLAFWLAEKGEDVFWFSVDPAHNISDVVKKSGLSKKTRIYKNLWAQEVDVEEFLKEYLDKTVKKMKSLYKQLQVSGMENIFEVMRLSPGMEESAILYAMHQVIKEEDHNYIIVDTPPTGLTLRILALPSINIKWLSVLKHWRLKILDRRRMITAVKSEMEAPFTPEEDKILQELEIHINLMKEMDRLFSNKEITTIILVLNQDKLSLRESERIKERLLQLGLTIDMVLVNKAGIVNMDEDVFKKSFSGTRLSFLPFLENRFQLEREDLLNLANNWVHEVI